MKSTHFVGLLACFTITLSVCLYHHLFAGHPVATLVFDSGHYLLTSRLLSTWWWHLLSPTAPAVSLQEIGNFLLMDGPLVPLMGSMALAVRSIHSVGSECAVLIVLGSVLQAFSAVLVCLLTRRLTGSMRWGIASGFAWGFYPAAVIGAGRFLTEPPVAFLLLCLTLCLSRLADSAELKWQDLLKHGMVQGFWTGLLLMTKPALLPAVLGVSILAGFKVEGWRRRLGLVCVTVAFTAAVVLPWVILIKATTGQTALGPQRVLGFNLAVGSDVESDGWAGIPMPSLTTMFAFDKPWPIVETMMSCRGGEFIDLTVRKIGRLWDEPWNDFRQYSLLMSPAWQAGYHRLILLLAVLGALIFGGETKLRLKDRSARFIGYACLILIIGHLIFVPFEALHRYAYTAMPFAVILATYCVWFAASSLSAYSGRVDEAEQRRSTVSGLLSLMIPVMLLWAVWAISRLRLPWLVSRDRDFVAVLHVVLLCLLMIWTWRALIIWLRTSCPSWRPGAIVWTLALALGSTTLAVSTASALNLRRVSEWKATLRPGQMAMRELSSAGDDALKLRRCDWVALAIDSDSSILDADLLVNGHRVQASPSPSYFLPSAFRYQLLLLDSMRILSQMQGLTPLDLRQWWIAPIPRSFLNQRGPNTVVVLARNKPVTVWGDYLAAKAKRRWLPSFQSFSLSKYENGCDADGRLLETTSRLIFRSVSMVGFTGGRLVEPAHVGMTGIQPQALGGSPVFFRTSGEALSGALNCMREGDCHIFIAIGRSQHSQRAMECGEVEPRPSFAGYLLDLR